ncbi:MAG: hypothetical protein HKO57_06240, partial [Akkermansiaceae bacterium]|nr:hypothetical protein [Akkermansiaceae bacterium]
LALYRLDLDPAHLHWAEALAAETLAKLGDKDAILLETPPDDRFGIFPIIHDAMVFGPSTWGTIYNPLGQLQQLGPRPEFEALLAAIRSRLVPALEKDHPFIHTDFAAGVLAEARGCLLLLEGDPEEAVFREMHQAALAPEFDGIVLVHLVPGLPSAFQLPEPTSGPKARIRRHGEDLGEALTAASLQQLLRETLASE